MNTSVREQRKLMFLGVAAVGVTAVCLVQIAGLRPAGRQAQAQVLPKIALTPLPRPEPLSRDPFARNLLVEDAPPTAIAGRANPFGQTVGAGLSGRISSAAVTPMRVQVPVAPLPASTAPETKPVLLRAVMGAVDAPVAFLQIGDAPAAAFSPGDSIVPGTVLEGIQGGAVRLRTARKVLTLEVGQQVKL